jgi:hypothetical protein
MHLNTRVQSIVSTVSAMSGAHKGIKAARVDLVAPAIGTFEHKPTDKRRSLEKTFGRHNRGPVSPQQLIQLTLATDSATAEAFRAIAVGSVVQIIAVFASHLVPIFIDDCFDVADAVEGRLAFTEVVKQMPQMGVRRVAAHNHFDKDDDALRAEGGYLFTFCAVHRSCPPRVVEFVYLAGIFEETTQAFQVEWVQLAQRHGCCRFVQDNQLMDDLIQFYYLPAV